ncbi:MAG: RidA family protein [Burkholderiales bacterium]|jgi:2-iminobutanoate/2-iminopropanoate deaminase|nr:RidA family protein [Burkholderiales bacterium]MBP9769599.1 RidA family protein [Burkholderiales bacterium]
MKAINTPFAPQAIGPYVQANQHGNIIYTSGQIPLTKDGVLAGEDIKTQTHQVMKNIEAILIEGGSDMTRLIKTTCFLSDMNNFAAFNEVYASYFERNLPARSCVEVARLPRDVLVEVEVIAVIPL